MTPGSAGADPGRPVAFGLDIESFIPLGGVTPGPGCGRHVSVEEGSAAPWPSGDATILVDDASPDGSTRRLLQHRPGTGYRLDLHPYGAYAISEDGDRVECSLPPDTERWLVERAIVGQVLPLVALLQGLEGFHASALMLDDRLIALTGPQGAGKSTLALTLLREGGRFFTDDVLVQVRGGADAVFGPGPAVANVHDPALLDDVHAGRAPYGRVLGSTATSVRALVSTAVSPSRLDALYLLDRRKDATTVRFREIDDPFVLLASTFNVAIRTPARLERQLDASEAIARTAGVWRVTAPPRLAPGPLAAEIARHVSYTRAPS